MAMRDIRIDITTGSDHFRAQACMMPLFMLSFPLRADPEAA